MSLAMINQQFPNSIIRSVTQTISGTANSITQATIKQGKNSQPTFILGFSYSETTGTLQNDAEIRGTVDSVDIVKLDVRTMLDQAGTPISQILRYIPVNVNLGTGAEFKLGHKSGSTASNFVYTVFFVYTSDKNNFVAGQTN